MENQINIGDKNTQQIGRVSGTQPAQIIEKPKINYSMIGGVILTCLVIFGGYYLAKQFLNKNLVSESDLIPTPSLTLSEASDETANWTSYNITTEPLSEYADYVVRVPSTWERIEHPSNFQDTEIFQDIYGQFIYQLVIHQQKNYNEQTGKPYTTLKELTGLPYDVTTLIVDGQQVARVLPRTGSEFIYKVLFFSKDAKLVISIELNTPRDDSKTQEGELLFNQILSTFKFLNKTSSANTPDIEAGAVGISYGLFYPFSNEATINNSEPTIIGKVNQSGQSYLSTKFGIEKSPVSGENEYFLRFIPGKVKNLEVKIDNLVIQDVYGISQYPTVLCKKINLNPNGSSSHDLPTGKKSPSGDFFTSENECFSQKSLEIPPLIFFAKSTNQLSSGKHILTVTSLGKIIGSMSFTINSQFKLPVQTITKANQLDYFSFFDIADNCSEGYYYDNNFLKIPLPTNNNRNLFYGVSFPQTEEEYGSIKRRKIQINFEGNQFELFFPQSIVFYDGKSFKNNTVSPEKAIFLPKDLLYFTDGKKAEPQNISPNSIYTGEYFEIYPVDISGYEYQGYSLPWQTSVSSGCDDQ